MSIDIEEIIDGKRKEMKKVSGMIDIDLIMDEIRTVSSQVKVAPVKKIVDCSKLMKQGDTGFVVLLYREFLGQEPEPKGYVDNLNLLLSGTLDRFEMIDYFRNLPNAVDIELTHYHKEFLKRKFYNKAMQIPVVGYILRLGKNIVFLSRNINSLHKSVELLQLECAKLEYENILLKEKLSLTENIPHLQWRCDDLDIRLQRSEKGNIDVLNKVNECVSTIENENKSLVSKEELDEIYVHYNEKLMPDSRESVKDRAKVYIPKLQQWLKDTERSSKEFKMVDLGCGECEWVELLAENGIKAIGVDDNVKVVEKVRQIDKGIQIEKTNAIEYLKACTDDSIDCISTFHMVEHFDFQSLIFLLKECNRVLKKDGLLIVETPNPLNILTSTLYFYMDPTHVKPIPIELMSFYLEECGFQIWDKFMLNPLNFVPFDFDGESDIKDIVFRFNMEQSYSIMAVKRI